MPSEQATASALSDLVDALTENRINEQDVLARLKATRASDFPGMEIAELNLRLAARLPGATFRLDELLQKIGEWAEIVQAGVHRMATRFEHAPADFNNSWPFFQVLVMVTVLQRNLGIRYRPDLMEDPVDWSDSRSRFIHGLLCRYGGTCASMPVLYVAIGRRLGWPLYLVGAKQHLFVRWEDTQDRFNIEATSYGLNTHSDEHYQKWPVPLSQYEIDRGWYLRNLTAQEEFANFVIDRALCLRDNMQFGEACKLGYVAREFAPHNPNFQGFHAIATVMHHAAAGMSRYDFEHDGHRLLRVVESHGTREPEAWEEWAAPIARSEYRRILGNHESKRSVRPFGGVPQRIQESQITD